MGEIKGRQGNFSAGCGGGRLNSMACQIISVVAFLFVVLRIIIFLSPQWSESYGRKNLAHAQAMRDGYALLRIAVQGYRNSYRKMSAELERSTY